MKERKEFRKECVKHFENADHSFTAAVYGQPVHYMENGEWKEIDNSIQLNREGRYENRENDFRVSFAKEAADEKLASISNGRVSFWWKLRNSQNVSARMENSGTKRTSNEDMELQNLISKVHYNNIIEGVDMDYTLSSKKLKESLVLKGGKLPDCFEFEFRTDGLNAVKEDDKRIKLSDDYGEILYFIENPYMMDAAGEVSCDVDVQLTEIENSGAWIYKLIPDKAWILSPERKWPVIIDPTITSVTSADEIQDNTVCSGYPTDNFYNSIFLQTGRSSGVGTCRSLINFTLPTLNSADTIVAAVLNVTCLDTGDGNTDTEERQVHLHRILKEWNTNTVTWNTMPDYESRIIDAASFVAENGKGIQFDITELVRDWGANGNQFGVMLKDKDESGHYTRYLASDCGDDLADFRPKVFVRYVNHTGLRSLWTYHTYDVRRAGRIHVNDHNGNLVFEHSIDAISGNRMPYAASLIYNSTDTTKDIGYGRGFRLNYHQTIVSKTIGGTQYYEWVDGSGSKRYFNKDSDGIWKDEENEDLKLTIHTSSASERYKITDKNDGVMAFDSGGFLVKISDANENSLNISYVSGHVSRVTDGSGRSLIFTYADGHLSQVQNPAGQTKTFTYNEDDGIEKITDFDGNEITMYWYKGFMLNVKNYDNYTIGWSYRGKPLRIYKVTEYSNNTACRSTTAIYGNGMNHFTDERGRRQTYMFAQTGQTVSIQNEEGYAQTRKYTGNGETAGKLSKESKLQYTSPQYMMNPHIFDSQTWTSTVGDGTQASINTNAAYARTGTRSLKITSQSTASQGMFGQYFTLTKGKTYTFSGYVRTEGVTEVGANGGAFLRAMCKDSEGNYIYSESRKVTDTAGEWAYLDVSFTMPENSSWGYVLFYLVHRNMIGTSYFDNLQVEEGPVGGRRNLIENNDFTYDGRKYTRGSTLDSMDCLVNLETLAQEEENNAETQEVRGQVNADVLNVRSGPGTGYNVVHQLVQGEIVTILGTVSGSGMSWYQIEYSLNGAVYTGYVAAEYIALLSGGIRTGLVNADLLNVRTGPGVSYTALAQLTYGTGVVILADTVSQSDGSAWYQIQFTINGTGYTGYAAADYIKETTLGGRPINTDKVPKRHAVLSPRVFRMKGNTAKQKRLLQVLPLSGKKGDTYVISAWGCGESLPIKDNRTFGVELIFIRSDGGQEYHVSNFKSCSGEWQFLNEVIVAREDYTSIWAGYTYSYNANTAYFDGLSLYKDEYWPSFTYDDKGNVISCTDAGNKKTTFAYDENSNITKVTTPKGADFKYVYDDKHNITEATTATNKKYKFTYDSYGNVTTVRIVNPDNENQYIQSAMEYTGNGNYMSKNTDCFGKNVSYVYDAASGNLTSVTDVNGKTTSYLYDMMGRLTSVSRTNKVNGTDTTIANNYTYENDRLKTISHNGMNYTFAYDSFGNLAQVKAGSHTLVSNTYKLNGTQLDKSILGNNTGACYEYDQYDRVIKEKSVKSNGTSVTEYEYLYDHDGNLAQVTDKVNNEEQHYFYSISGQTARAESSTGASVQYEYDENDTLKAVRTTYNQVSKQMSYEYDADYNETKTTTMGGKTLTSEYDALGRVLTQRFNTDNQYTVTYGYRDGANGSASAMVQSMSNNGRLCSYLYHDDGNIRQIQTPWITQTFEYDAIGQLTRVNDDDTGYTTVYSYDAGGNMTEETVYDYTTAAIPTTEVLSQRTFTYDTVWKDQMLTCGGKPLTYDGAGNLLSYDGAVFTWTRGRRLSGATKADGTEITYTYNHNGQRVSKTVGGVKHTYFYSGNLLMCEKASGLDMRFSYNSVGNPVSILYNNVEYYYVKNLQGDVIGLINAAGTWVVEYIYDVWGNIRNVFGTMATTLGQDNPIRYRGYYYDTETKLYYVSSRYYSPEICRFISADDIEPFSRSHENSVQYNLYAYCWNNPVNMFDGDGEWPEWVKKAVAIVAVAAVVVAATVVTVATFGAGSMAGVAAITATATFAARATEVAVLQVRKSSAEGLDAKKIATNVAEAIYDNGTRVIGMTPGTKMASLGIHYGLNVQIEEIFGGKASFSETLKSSGGKVIPYGFVAYNWAHVLYSLFCKKPTVRAKKRRYNLK